MKSLSLLLILTFILTACTNADITPTATLAPTETPAPTATITPTSTETPDPLAGAPDGATGENSKGEWAKTVIENGKEVAYEWNAELNGWFASHVEDGSLNGGIPLVEDDDATYLEDMVPMFIYFQEGIPAPVFRHPAHPYSKAEAPYSLTGFFTGMLHDADGLNSFERLDAQKAGAISFPFQTPDGKSYGWNPNKTTGYTFYGVKWKDLTPENYPDLTIFETRNFNTSLVYRWAVFTDKDHNLIALGAVEHPEDLDTTLWVRLILGPLGPVTQFTELDESIVGFSRTQPLVRAALRDQNPHLEVVQDQP